MIPTHKLIDPRAKDIRVIKLDSLSQYNIMEPHRHEYVELFFFDKGRGTHEIDFHPFDVEPKSIHLVSAGRVHRLKRELNSEGFVILFHPSVFKNDGIIAEFLFELDCYDVTEYAPIYKFEETIQSSISDTIKSLWEHYQGGDPNKYYFILNKLSLVFLHCISYAQTEKKNNPKDQKEYILFRQHLRQNFRVMRKVSEYSNLMGITGRKLNEMVSSRTGLSVSQLIQKQVVLEAQRLLNSGLSSKEIAYDLKFEDPAHFSKYFKKQTGLSPSEFQKIHF